MLDAIICVLTHRRITSGAVAAGEAVLTDAAELLPGDGIREAPIGGRRARRSHAVEHRIRAVRTGEIVRAEFGALAAFPAGIGKAFQLGHVEITLNDPSALAALAAGTALATQRQRVAVYPILKNRVCPRELRPRLGILALFAAAPALPGGDHHIVDRCGAFRDLELAGAGEDYPLVQILRRLRLRRGEADQCIHAAFKCRAHGGVEGLDTRRNHLLIVRVIHAYHVARFLMSTHNVIGDSFAASVIVCKALRHGVGIHQRYQCGICN